MYISTALTKDFLLQDVHFATETLQQHSLMLGLWAYHSITPLGEKYVSLFSKSGGQPSTPLAY